MTRTIGALLFLLPLAVAARADVLTVETAADALHAPPEKSLRHILTIAKAGDTIRFAQNFVIVMDGAQFEVAPALAGIRIEGPVQIRRDRNSGRFLVRAPGAVIRDVQFDNVFARVRADETGVADDIAGVEIRSCTFTRRAGVQFERAVGCVVEGSTFTIDARNAGDIAGISGLGLTSSRLSGNTITMLGGRPAGAIDLLGGTDVVVEDTTCHDADIVVWAESAIVRRNFATNGFIDVRGELQNGSYEVRGNHCAVLSVVAVDAVTADNVVGEGTAPRTRRATKPKVALRVIGHQTTASTYAGPIVVSGNRVRGGSIFSISCTTGSLTTSVSLSDNEVTEPARMAVFVSTDTPTTVAHTRVTGDGAKGSGNGIRIGRSPAGGTRVEESTIDGVRGDGIAVDRGARATLIHNRMTRCSRYGLAVHAGARGDSSRDVADANGRDGLAWGPGATGSAVDGTATGNGGAGIWIDAGATVAVRRVASSGNAGAGIDLAPRGVTPNAKKKTANRGLRWPAELEWKSGSVVGTTVPGGIVEVSRVEGGARAGNPANGEGAAFLAQGVADGDGAFAVKVDCVAGDLLTVTVTAPGASPVTSEFSEDVVCEEGVPIELVSASPAGAPADQIALLGSGGEGDQSVGGGGRWITFWSAAPNLAGNADGVTHVYLRDTQEDVTVRVTRRHDGAAFDPGEFGTNGLAGHDSSVSDDGRFIAYQTPSNQVIAGDEDRASTVVLFDRDAGTTVAVTDPTRQTPLLPDGTQTHRGGREPSISGDGSCVAFISLDRYWVAGDASFDEDVFVWTRATGAIERVSVPSGGGDVPNPGTSVTSSPRLSHDGRFVVFTSYQDLVPGSGVTGPKVFWHDRQTGTTEIASVNSAGAAGRGGQPQVSDDGRYVVFLSGDALVPEDTDGGHDVYRLDRTTHEVRRVSVRLDAATFVRGVGAPSMSGDGGRVVFQIKGEYEVPGGITVVGDLEIHLADLVAGTLEEASLGPTGEAFGNAYIPCLSRDGRALVFQSNAQNLTPETPSDFVQVYVRRLPAAE